MLKFGNHLNLLNRQLAIRSQPKFSSTVNRRCFSDKPDQEKPTISQNIEEDLKKLRKVRHDLSQNDSVIYNEYKQTEKGFIYDKKPVKVNCKKGKIYMWCACGHSKHQVGWIAFILPYEIQSIKPSS